MTTKKADNGKGNGYGKGNRRSPSGMTTKKADNGKGSGYGKGNGGLSRLWPACRTWRSSLCGPGSFDPAGR
jgi:hypothetical protein